MPVAFTPTLVKRIAGSPGDTLYMRAGQLFLNGTAQSLVAGAEHNPRIDGEFSTLEGEAPLAAASGGALSRPVFSHQDWR